MMTMTSTRSNRRALISGLICGVVLGGIGLLLDLQGVRFPSTLIPGLVAAGITVAVIVIEALSLFLRRTLSDVNDHLVFGKPKTATSRGRSPQVQPTPTARLSAAAAERAAEAATRAVMTPASG
jgi:hypothetical protein